MKVSNGDRVMIRSRYGAIIHDEYVIIALPGETGVVVDEKEHEVLFDRTGYRAKVFRDDIMAPGVTVTTRPL